MTRDPADRREGPNALRNARRDALIVAILVAAIALLLWNSSSFLREVRVDGRQIGAGSQVASTAMLLNLALIMFGWRRYIDLQQEATRRREGEDRARLAERLDAQTSLLNRKGLSESGEALRLQALAKGEQLVLMSLQVERMKAVFDRHGHEVGDSYLRHVADALSEACGGDCVLARVGGDAFAIAATAASDRLSAAETLAGTALAAVALPCEVGGRIIQLRGVAGLAAAPAADVGMADLLRRADIALGHARTGRSLRPMWFDSAMESALNSLTDTEQQVRSGIERGEFVPFFEPQIDLRTGTIIGFEVLVRWAHPVRGIVAPDAFLGIVEEMGLMNRLSEAVIKSALAKARHWDPSIKIAVNIAPSQLSDGWLAERILRLLTETGFPAERLVIEITETSLFADIDIARTLIASLKNQGVRIALDDFGTGFSSLSYLRSLPFDLIKIDRSFVSTIHLSHESEAIVKAVVALADGLRVPVLVEGIECEASLSRVVALGCTFGQGWHFGRAVSADCAAALLSEASETRVARRAAVR